MAFKMNARSPLMKTLVGAQKNLPQGLKSAIEAAPGKMMDSPAKGNSDLIAGAAVKGVVKPAKDMSASPAKMNRGERYDMKMASDQNLKASARKNYAENAEAAQKSSPAKVGVIPSKDATKTSRVMGPPEAPKAKAKPKYDKELNTLVASRKGLKKGTAEYNTIQNKINSKLGSKKVHGRGTSTAPKIASKKVSVLPQATQLKPTIKAPAKPTAAAAKPKAKATTPNVRTIGGGAANGGSTTLTVKTGGGANKGGSTKREKVTKNSKKVVTKTAGTRTVEKTNKDGSSSTKTTKRIGKGRIKGAIKDARLARLDRVASRQAAKAKGSGKKPGSKTEQFG